MQYYAMKPITVTSYDTEFTSSWTVKYDELRWKIQKMHIYNKDKQFLKMTMTKMDTGLFCAKNVVCCALNVN